MTVKHSNSKFTFKLLSSRCIYIHTLDLSHCLSLNSNDLNSIVSEFGKTLKFLNLSFTKLTDEDAAIIGFECKKLAWLSIEGCTKLSKYGIQSLFFNQQLNKVTPLAKTISVFKMFFLEIDDSNVIVKKILTLWALNLKCCSYFEIIEILDDISLSPNSKPLCLESISPLLVNSFKDYSRLFRILPNLLHLILPVDLEFWQSFLTVIDSCNKNLKSLNVQTQFPPTWLYIIGCKLLELECLTVTMSGLIYDERLEHNLIEAGYNLNENSWKKLRILNFFFISHNIIPTPVFIISMNIIRTIVEASHHSLKEIHIRDYPYGEINHFVQWICSQNYLESIEVLDLGGCACICAETIWQVILQQNNINKIILNDCRFVYLSDYNRMCEYISRNNLKLIIEFDIS